MTGKILQRGQCEDVARGTIQNGEFKNLKTYSESYMDVQKANFNS
jgi:hypothetical protein